MPLKSRTKHWHKVDFKMGLSAGGEGVDAAVFLLVFDVFLGFVEVVVNSRESRELEETTAIGTSLVLALGSHCAVVHGSGSKQMVVECVSVLHAEDVGQNGMVEEILTNVARLNNGLNAVGRKFLLGSDSRQHQEFGGLENTT